MNPRLRIIVIGLVVIAAAAIGYGIFSVAGNQRQRLDQSEFYEAVAEGQVEGHPHRRQHWIRDPGQAPLG